MKRILQREPRIELGIREQVEVSFVESASRQTHARDGQVHRAKIDQQALPPVQALLRGDPTIPGRIVVLLLRIFFGDSEVELTHAATARERDG